ncbi:hypothetical protein VTI28DRAFT_8255 [Corynascus sepedonium]
MSRGSLTDGYSGSTPARKRASKRASDFPDAVKLPDRNQPKANILQLVYSWLSNERNSKWIMILDSADGRDVFYGKSIGRPIATYLPQSRNGSFF